MTCRARLMPAFALPLLMAACGDPGTDYPALLPTAALLAEPVLPPHVGDAGAATAAPAQSRAEALRARAGALRGPVIEPATRARMAAAPARNS